MYINDYCSISPAGVLLPATSTGSLQAAAAGKAACIEPDYKELIPPMQLRRMTKPVRTGVAAAKLCLNGKIPDAIHVGTAYGMLQDSENFLEKMIGQEEQMLNPTAFIQSTHNTVSGQIALSIGCMAHNMTYVHKAHSFESALLDAAAMLEDDPGNAVLAGAVDECTDTSYTILQRFGRYTTESIAGEGAAFFLLSAERKVETIARLTAFDMFTIAATGDVEAQLEQFCTRHKVSLNDDDLLLLNAPDLDLANSLFQHTATVACDRYCGAYPTASSFGLALALAYIKESKAPRCWILSGWGRHYSIFLVEGV